MVRHRELPGGGIEEIPEPCPNDEGHLTTPAWTSCPRCGYGTRVWRCTVCPDTQVIDPDHQCRNLSG
ncbi:hypothetical protein [Micromonospora chersina]